MIRTMIDKEDLLEALDKYCMIRLVYYDEVVDVINSIQALPVEVIDYKEKERLSRNAVRKNNYAQTAPGVRHRETWTKEEQDLVLAHKCSDRELSSMIGRSVQAIQVQRNRLKSGSGKDKDNT